MQTSRPEDLRGEAELLFPVSDDWPPEEILRPAIHLTGDLLGGGQKYRIVMNRQLQVSLVVERHRGQLTESVLAVEHPTVGARQQRVGDVANALLDGGPRL